MLFTFSFICNDDDVENLDAFMSSVCVDDDNGEQNWVLISLSESSVACVIGVNITF